MKTTTQYMIRKGDTTDWEVVTRDGAHVADARSREDARRIKRKLDTQTVEMAAREADDPGAGVAVEDLDDMPVTNRQEAEAFIDAVVERTGQMTDEHEFVDGDDSLPEVVSTRMLPAGDAAAEDWVTDGGSWEYPEPEGRPDPEAEVLVPSLEEQAARDEADRLAAEVAAEHAQVDNDNAAVAAMDATRVDEVTAAKAAKAAHESEVARKLQPGQRIALREVGTVTITEVAKIKGQQKVLVSYTTEHGAGQRELWVNSRYRLVA